MSASGQENTRLISNRMIKNKKGILFKLCGGKIELMSQRSSVQICSGKVTEQVSSAQSRTGDEHLIKLSGEKCELELALHKKEMFLLILRKNKLHRYVHFVMGRKNILDVPAHTRCLFMKLFMIQKHYIIY